MFSLPLETRFLLSIPASTLRKSPTSHAPESSLASSSLPRNPDPGELYWTSRSVPTGPCFFFASLLCEERFRIHSSPRSFALMSGRDILPRSRMWPVRRPSSPTSARCVHSAALQPKPQPRCNQFLGLPAPLLVAAVLSGWWWG